MKTTAHIKQAKGGPFDRDLGVSRLRAAAIARAHVASAMIGCDVSDERPEVFGYGVRPLPKDCWYVRCISRLAPLCTAGTSLIVCISKLSGRVLRIESQHGE